MIQGALEGVALKWGALESGFMLDCSNTPTPATFGLSCTVICFSVVLLESSRVVGNIDRRSHLRECVDVIELTPWLTIKATFRTCNMALCPVGIAMLRQKSFSKARELSENRHASGFVTLMTRFCETQEEQDCSDLAVGSEASPCLCNPRKP